MGYAYWLVFAGVVAWYWFHAPHRRTTAVAWRGASLLAFLPLLIGLILVAASFVLRLFRS